MCEKLNSSENSVKKNKIAKNQRNLNIFNVDEDKSFLTFCKQISEVNFKSKNKEISEDSTKLGKSVLCVSKNIKYVHYVLLITQKGQRTCLYNFKFYIELNLKQTLKIQCIFYVLTELSPTVQQTVAYQLLFIISIVFVAQFLNS